MKKIYLFVLFLILLFSPLFWRGVGGEVVAQSPQGINYQAVARDASGNPLASQPVSIEFKIHQTTSGGTVVYDETHSTTTNQFGLFTAIIGQGSIVSGTFSSIPWGSDIYFLEVFVNSNNMGNSQFLSVPYSLYSLNGTTGATGSTGLTGATGSTGLLDGGTTAGNTPYWNGSNWIVNSSNIHNNGGNVGIGTTMSPKSTLKVNGSIAGNFVNPTVSLYTCTPKDYFVYTTIGGSAITLPYANSVDAGSVLIIRNKTDGDITVNSQGTTDAIVLLNTAGGPGGPITMTTLGTASTTSMGRFISDGIGKWIEW